MARRRCRGRAAEAAPDTALRDGREREGRPLLDGGRGPPLGLGGERRRGPRRRRDAPRRPARRPGLRPRASASPRGTRRRAGPDGRRDPPPLRPLRRGLRLRGGGGGSDRPRRRGGADGRRAAGADRGAQRGVSPSLALLRRRPGRADAHRDGPARALRRRRPRRRPPLRPGAHPGRPAGRPPRPRGRRRGRPPLPRLPPEPRARGLRRLEAVPRGAPEGAGRDDVRPRSRSAGRARGRRGAARLVRGRAGGGPPRGGGGEPGRGGGGADPGALPGLPARRGAAPGRSRRWAAGAELRARSPGLSRPTAGAPRYGRSSAAITSCRTRTRPRSLPRR